MTADEFAPGPGLVGGQRELMVLFPLDERFVRSFRAPTARASSGEALLSADGVHRGHFP